MRREVSIEDALEMGEWAYLGEGEYVVVDAEDMRAAVYCTGGCQPCYLTFHCDRASIFR